MNNQNENSKPENKIQKQENNIKKISFIELCELIIFIYFLTGVVCLLFDQYFTKISLINSIYSMAAIYYIMILSYVCILYLIFGCLSYKHKSLLLSIIDCVLCSWVIAPVSGPIIFIFECIFNFFNIPNGIDIFQVNKLYHCIGLVFSFFPLLFYNIYKEKIGLFHILRIVTRLLIVAYIILFMLDACDVDVYVGLN